MPSSAATPSSIRVPKYRDPKYSVHKATGQGYVVLNGQARYLGQADAPATAPHLRRLERCQLHLIKRCA
ncbi:MAG: hypothetical protein IPM18_12715 [Phycisphaerales bacterium]|nr:hypothetical protein [Phycisphaerales bacterium]